MPSSNSVAVASSGFPADPDQNGSPLASRFCMSEDGSLFSHHSGQRATVLLMISEHSGLMMNLSNRVYRWSFITLFVADLFIL